jgi:hypothetical protein
MYKIAVTVAVLSAISFASNVALADPWAFQPTVAYYVPKPPPPQKPAAVFGGLLWEPTSGKTYRCLAVFEWPGPSANDNLTCTNISKIFGANAPHTPLSIQSASPFFPPGSTPLPPNGYPVDWPNEQAFWATGPSQTDLRVCYNFTQSGYCLVAKFVE